MKIGRLLVVLRWIFGIMAVVLSIVLVYKNATLEWDNSMVPAIVPYFHIMKSDNPELSMCRINFDSIAQHRQLHSSNASALLREFWEFDKQQPPYNNVTDLIVFEHPLKTGGTSLSFKLNEIFGQDAIVPGSGASDFFNKAAFQKQIKKLQNGTENLKAWWRSKKAMYSHSHFQENGTRGEEFESWVLKQIPKDDNNEPLKKIHLMTLYREPVEYLASNMFEWMCRLGARIREAFSEIHKTKRKPTIQHPINDPECWGLRNLTLLADHFVNHTLPKICQDPAKNKIFGKECKKWKLTGDDPMPQCRSAEGFVNHRLFKDRLRYNPESVLSESGGSLPGDSVGDVEKRSLARLGGMEPMWSVPLRWIGLTERYDEFLLLLYDWMELSVPQSLGNDTKERYKKCRPSSFWSSSDQRMVLTHAWKSKVVHNVVNAIMDVRIADWCCRQRQSLAQSHQSPHNEDKDYIDSIFQRFCSDGLLA